MPPTSSLLGLILAGGRSSRMGTDKASLARPDGRTQLQFTCDCLAGCVNHIAVAGGCTVPPNAVLLPDPVEYQGPITGLISGLAYARSRGDTAVLALPVDLPSLAATDLQRLCTRWQHAPTTITLASADGQHPEPLIGIYPATYLDSLQACAAGLRRSIKRWLETHDVALVPLDPRSLANANTPAEFHQAFERP